MQTIRVIVRSRLVIVTEAVVRLNMALTLFLVNVHLTKLASVVNISYKVDTLSTCSTFNSRLHRLVGITLQTNLPRDYKNRLG